MGYNALIVDALFLIYAVLTLIIEGKLRARIEKLEEK